MKRIYGVQTTLYTKEQRENRVTWFSEWNKKNKEYSQQDIIQFHKNKQDAFENEGILINRDAILFTVSLASVFKNEVNEVSLYYEDFIQHKNKMLVI